MCFSEKTPPPHLGTTAYSPVSPTPAPVQVIQRYFTLLSNPCIWAQTRENGVLGLLSRPRLCGNLRPTTLVPAAQPWDRFQLSCVWEMPPWPGARRRWAAGWSARGRCQRVSHHPGCLAQAAFSERAPSCCSFRQRKKDSYLWALRIQARTRRQARTLPSVCGVSFSWGFPPGLQALLFSCLLWSFSASRILLHSPTGTQLHS